MAIGSTALANFLIILVIGIVAGLAFNRYARSWLARLGTTTGATSPRRWWESRVHSSASTSASSSVCYRRRSCTSSWRL